jgi:hypothetical protein
MISEIQTHLEALSAKYQSNQSRLVKPEAQEAGRLLREALSESSKGIDLCFRFATVLPPEAVSSAIVEKWDALDEGSRGQVIERLQKLPEPGGRRLRLVLSRSLQKIDPMLARRTLAQACYSFVDPKTQRISQKNALTFRAAMLDERAPALLGFHFSNAIQAEVAALLACIWGTVFAQGEDNGGKFSPLAPRVLEWLWNEGLFGMLKPSQRAILIEATKGWPQRAKDDLLGKFNPLPPELEFLANLPLERSPSASNTQVPSESNEARVGSVSSVPLLGNSFTSPPSGSSSESPPLAALETIPEEKPLLSSPNVPISNSEMAEPQDGPVSKSTPLTTGAPPRIPSEIKFSARELLGHLADLIKDLENANRAARSEITEQRLAIQGLKSRMSNFDTNFNKLEVELREARHQAETLRTDLKASQGEAERLRDDSERLRNQLVEAKKLHDSEAEALAGRVTIESERVVEAFKNSLGRKLRLEWRDFEDVSGIGMTPEIGESHRRQLREIFALLEREGIQITK